MTNDYTSGSGTNVVVNRGRLDYEMLMQTNNKVLERGRPEQRAERKV